MKLDQKSKVKEALSKERANYNGNTDGNDDHYVDMGRDNKKEFSSIFMEGGFFLTARSWWWGRRPAIRKAFAAASGFGRLTSGKQQARPLV